VHILVTGGAGFIGYNAVTRFMERGHRVTVLDNLSRRGARANLGALQAAGLGRFVQCDVRDSASLTSALHEAGEVDSVLHLAAQVAVTTSLTNPREDF